MEGLKLMQLGQMYRVSWCEAGDRLTADDEEMLKRQGVILTCYLTTIMKLETGSAADDEAILDKQGVILTCY